VSFDLLAQLPSADLRVYALWMPILSHDSRESVDPTLVPDPRATRYWDQEALSGTFFKGRPEFAAHWDAMADGPSHSVSSGWTIIAEAEKLRFGLLALLAHPWPRVFLPWNATRR
jgi:hypothetical protein